LSDSKAEANLIQSLFAPLTLGEQGAYGLRDDAAFLPSAAHGLIVTQDQVIEGTHFLPNEPLHMIAKRLVRRNLSDMIAKGGVPTAAFLSIAWPKSRDRADVALFARGLGEDLEDLCGACPLMGGDTSQTSSHLIASLTMMGRPLAKSGQPVLRSGAKVGDIVAVTGVIGDAWLGLMTRQEVFNWQDYRECVKFSLAPSPPDLGMAALIARYAHASIDISDGLLLDASRIAEASGLAIEIELEKIPVSREGDTFCDEGDRENQIMLLATGGDDYQPLITLSPTDFEAYREAAEEFDVTVTEIGMCVEGQGIKTTYEGEDMDLPLDLGWQI
jgi:thiamine-monophosphate kinase